MTIDLEKMNRKELEKHLKDVEKALKAAKVKERRDALKAAEQAAAEYGFSLSELSDATDGKGRKAKRTVNGTGPKSEPQFVNPENTEQTWTGKGRQPNWFRDALQQGKDPEEMRI